MEKYKSPKANLRPAKEIKKIKIKSKDNESFHYSKSPSINKSFSNNDTVSLKNKKNLIIKNDISTASYNYSNPKINDKNKISEIKIKSDNPIRETILYNIPTRSKGRSLEKIPSEVINRNNNHPNLDFNKTDINKNINIMDRNKKNKNMPVKNSSVGKANSNYTNKYNNSKNFNLNNKINQISINNNNNKINEFDDNIDNLQNINIDQEQSKQYNYINYNIINNNINSSTKITKAEEVGEHFNNFNSLCVSINNNYNYNVSLETPTQPEQYNDFINKAIIEQTIDKNNLQNNNKNKDMDINMDNNWKEKISKINKQKNTDYKKLNNTDNNFWRLKKEVIKPEDNLNKTDNNFNMNPKQKIKKVNSYIKPRENKFNNMNKTENEITNEDLINEPKKKTGLFGFFNSFRDMFVPASKKKKNNKYNNDSTNNSANIGKNNIKDRLFQSDDGKIQKINKFRKTEYHTVNAPQTENNNNTNIYSKRKINMNNINDGYNANYYSDSGYESCPTPNNPQKFDLYNSSQTVNNSSETPNDRQILSYNQRNNFKNSNNNNTYNSTYNNDNLFKNDTRYNKVRTESSSEIMNPQIQNYNNNNKTQEIHKNNNLFNNYDIKNDKTYKKDNLLYNNNITKLTHMLSESNISSSSTNNNNYIHNSAYIKKTRKRILSPTQNNKNDNNNTNNNINYNNTDNEIETRRLAYNKNNNNINNDNVHDINLNNINIGRENKYKIIDRQNMSGNYDKNKYNSENINENLNINAERHIQEIKININYKKDNNTINYSTIHPLNYEVMNNNKINNTNKYFNIIDDFVPEPKPKNEIESCIISFDRNKNKPRKIYENNLHNTINTPNYNYYYNNNNLSNINNNFNNINNNYNIINNNNFNNINNNNFNNINNNNFNNINNINNNYYNNFNYNNFNNINDNRLRITENYSSSSYSNIYDINNSNNNNSNYKNIYSKPSNKNINLNQNDKVKLEKKLSLNDLNKDTNNRNFDTPKPIKRRIIINKNYKINKLSDSEEFDNDIKSVNSDTSQNSNNEFNRTQMLPSSQITNSIYNKPSKSFMKNDKNNNSSNNSYQAIFRKDNSKYNTDTDVNIKNNYNDREFSMTTPGYTNTNMNYNFLNVNIEKIPSNNNRTVYINKNNDLDNIDNNINNNILNSGQVIYNKKSNSTKNTKAINISNISPFPYSDYSNINNNIVRVNNIRTIIRPKIKQKKRNYIEKLYNYSIKYPKNEEKDFYYSRQYLKILKLPLKQISLYTKYYYKILQKPIIKSNYIDKKIIVIKKGINLPISEKCLFVKKRKVIINTSIKKDINEKKNTQIDDEEYINLLNKDSSEVDYELNDNDNNDKDISNENKKENSINLDKKSETNEFERNTNQNININDEIINNNRKYHTPTLLKNEEKHNLSHQYSSITKNNPPKSAQNKIISIEINLNNKENLQDKNDSININRNLNINPLYNNNVQFNINEPLYIRKKPNNNINKIHYNTEGDKCKTYNKNHKKSIDDITINKFNNDNNNNNNIVYPNSSISKSNKIICIDIDLSKEQKKIKEQMQMEEPREVKTYKRPALVPLIDPMKNLKNKIDSITINYDLKNKNNISNNLNIEQLKQEIIIKLNIISENNLILIVDELFDLLTKKTIINNINNNMNYNKVRLSFMEILNNEYSFSEIIINRVIYDINKITVYADLCNQLCIRLTKEINFSGNDNEEDLKTILMEESKLKFEEIIKDNENNIKDNKLLGIILFISELINYRVISVNTGYYCFEKLCYKYNNCLDNNIKYYYLDIIVEFLRKFGRFVYIMQNSKYMERIENYADEELKKILNNDTGLPILLVNKIVNLIKSIKNHWMI